MDANPAQPKLTVFCGKGGTGKTTLSLAWGLWHSMAGRSVLVVSSHPLQELAVSISLHGLKERHPEAAANLFIVHIDPREILGNKIRQQIPSGFVAERILSSKLYQNVVEIAPGLKELALLARLRQLSEGKPLDDENRRFDLLIWDAPATGHFLQTLRVARNFHTYFSGPFAVLGKELAGFLSDSARIRIVPVAILEEMAVDETIELCRDLTNELEMPPAALICNLASPLLASPEDADPGIFSGSAAAGAGDCRFILDRLEIERRLFRKLDAAFEGMPAIIERVPDWDSELDLLESLANALGKSLGSAV